MDSVARQNSVLPGTIDDSTQSLDSRRPDASSSQPCQRSARPCALDATSRSRTWPFAGNLPPSPIDDIRPFGPLTGSFGPCYAASGVAATVVRWHRAGFRRNSFQGRRHDRPPLSREVRTLIRRMASEDPWGAPRIHGKLLRLGFSVSERSVSRYLCILPRAPRPGPKLKDFPHHLRRLLAQFIGYYHIDRTHLGLGKDSPFGCPVEYRPTRPDIQHRRRPSGRRLASPLPLAPGGVASPPRCSS
jgi:hypothetical protein